MDEIEDKLRTRGIDVITHGHAGGLRIQPDGADAVEGTQSAKGRAAGGGVTAERFGTNPQAARYMMEVVGHTVSSVAVLRLRQTPSSPAMKLGGVLDNLMRIITIRNSLPRISCQKKFL